MGKFIFVNNETRHTSSQEENPGKHLVNKYIYLTLTAVFGFFGLHKLYARKYVAALLYLLFCWTFIPAILALFDFIKGAGALRDEKDRIWV